LDGQRSRALPRPKGVAGAKARRAGRLTEVQVSLFIRAAPSKRDLVLLEVIYAGGLRISEAVNLTWSDVIQRDDRAQLSITGKGGKVRQVLLPDIVSRSLLSLRSDAGGVRQPQGRRPGRAALAAPRPRLTRP
jgi:integrase